MKTGRNLQEVLVELNRQNQAKQDFISPAQGMRLREDGQTFEINHLTTSQQEVFGTTSLFHRQVASALGIPAKYYDLMQAQKPELLAENVNSWFSDKPSSYMVRSMDYGAGQVARALLSERYRRIDNMEIATAVLPLFAGNDQYEVMSCEVTENRLYLKVVNHRLEMEVRKGDIVQAGVMISNSEVGLGAVSIQPLVYRLVCTNGLIVGARIAAINIRHMGHTGEDVIAASLRLASETPRIMDDIRRMQGVELPYKRQVDFVHEAARLRLGDDYEDRIRPEALLSPRRWNDIGFTAGGPATVWQCFNRVQENLIRGGVPLKPQKDGVRRRSLLALNGIDGNTRLNRELWDLADSYTLNN